MSKIDVSNKFIFEVELCECPIKVSDFLRLAKIVKRLKSLPFVKEVSVRDE